MEKLYILCVDDQREILATLRKDLAMFEDFFELVDLELAEEAEEFLEEVDAKGEHVALIICDHIMPNKTGVDFLIGINKDHRFEKIKKLLLTGQATHQDTIHAINQASINQYMEKPWEKEKLIHTVKLLITEFIITSGLEYQPFLKVLDQPLLYKLLHQRS